MKTSVKIALIVAAALVVVGGILIAVAFSMGGLFGSEDINTVTHTTDGTFDRILISTVTGTDVTILPSDTSACYAVCDETERIRYDLEVQNGTLALTERDGRHWYDFVGIFIGTRRVVLYLPARAYASLTVESSSGDITCTDKAFSFGDVTLSASSGDMEFASPMTGRLAVENASGEIYLSGVMATSATIHATSGEIDLSDMACASLLVTTSSGNIALDGGHIGELTVSATSGNISLCNVVASGNVTATASSGTLSLENVLASSELFLETSSGNITFARSDAPAITLRASSGEINGTLLSGKLFDTHTSSGNISCPPSVADGGTCSAHTSSGNIYLSVIGK